ncbi:MAG: hypothetical protein AAF799_14460 [Myxococcota bacterium]
MKLPRIHRYASSYAPAPTGAVASSRGLTPNSKKKKNKSTEYVVRGGQCNTQDFINGAENNGFVQDDDDEIDGLSVNLVTAPTSIKSTQSSVYFCDTTLPQKSRCAAKRSDIEGAGGTVEEDPIKGNADHAKVSGLTAKQLNSLFTRHFSC